MALFCRDEAEMNYLKIAQDLEMYGVNYFPIAVSALFQQFSLAADNEINYEINEIPFEILQGVWNWDY